MTEKRFVAIGVEWTDGFIQDHIGDRDLFNVGAVCNLLNELSEENEQLKSTINTLTHDNTKMKKVLNTTKKENEHIKNTIQEAYNNERTKLGQSVLKQLLNNIEG